MCYMPAMKFRHADLLMLAAAAALLLVIPSRDMGPFDAFNPFRIWLIVVLLLGIGAFGQLANQWLGVRYGLPLAGFVSGFVSSTATIMAVGLQTRKNPGLHAPAVAAAILSSVATYVQMALLIAALNMAVLKLLLPSLIAGGLMAFAYSLYFTHRAHTSHGHELRTHNALTLKAALALAGIITLITASVAVLHHYFGTGGVWLGSAIAGLADTHAAATSVVLLVNSNTLLPEQALIPILLGLTTNSLLRMSVTLSAGSKKFTAEVAPGLLLALLAAWAGALPVLL